MSEDISVKTEILKLRERAPFVPFEIVMSSGDRYRVAEANELVVGTEAIVVLSVQRARHCTLRFNQVSSVEVPEPA